MPLMHEAIKTVRSKSAAKEIFLMYEDQPNNDFKSLFYYTQVTVHDVQSLRAVGFRLKLVRPRAPSHARNGLKCRDTSNSLP